MRRSRANAMADRANRAQAIDRAAAPEVEDHLARARSAERFLLRHRARRPLEWDLRLESSEQPASDWWLPRGLPWAPDDKRKAQPEAIGDAPAASAWDRGRARVVLATDRELVVELDGRRVRGRYALRRERAGGWLVERLDPATTRPMPRNVLPMLAHAAAYPKDEKEFAYELKWDGVRALAYVADGRVVLRSRNQVNVTDQYPELQGLGEALGGHEAVLDGEIVALDARGRSSFQLLQGRLGVTSKGIVRQRMAEIPVIYVAFDLLYLDGQNAMPLPYEERRALLEGLHLRGAHWQVPPVVIGDGRTMMQVPGAEGVIAKRLGSPYEPGARSSSWLKIKHIRRQELVIGGYTAGKGARRGTIGSVMVGYYDESGTLHYAGNVGTGFNERTLRDLETRMAGTERSTSPFAEAVDKPGTFVQPRLVGEFVFTEWTRDGRLRHPSFKGLRFDKDPREVRREEPAEPPEGD